MKLGTPPQPGDQRGTFCLLECSIGHTSFADSLPKRGRWSGNFASGILTSGTYYHPVWATTSFQDNLSPSEPTQVTK